VALGQLLERLHHVASRATEPPTDLSRVGHLPAAARLAQDFEPNLLDELGVHHGPAHRVPSGGRGGLTDGDRLPVGLALVPLELIQPGPIQPRSACRSMSWSRSPHR